MYLLFLLNHIKEFLIAQCFPFCLFPEVSSYTAAFITEVREEVDSIDAEFFHVSDSMLR